MRRVCGECTGTTRRPACARGGPLVVLCVFGARNLFVHPHIHHDLYSACYPQCPCGSHLYVMCACVFVCLAMVVVVVVATSGTRLCRLARTRRLLWESSTSSKSCTSKQRVCCSADAPLQDGVLEGVFMTAVLCTGIVWAWVQQRRWRGFPVCVCAPTGHTRQPPPPCWCPTSSPPVRPLTPPLL